MQNRRHFLKHMAGLSALALPGLGFWNKIRAAETQLKKDNKSLIIMWMNGGASHMDLWDLKPDSPAGNGGDFKPIKTKADGVMISEVLPTLAEQFKNLSIVRSLVTNEGSHDRGTTLMNTGRQPSPIVQFPAMGSVVSSQLTPKDAALPGFIGIGGTATRIGPGFLGSLYSPFSIQNPGQPPQNIKPPQSLGNEDDAKARMLRRQKLFGVVEDHFGDNLYPAGTTSAQKKDLGSAAESHETIYGKAFDLTIPKPGTKLDSVFDISKEDPKTIEAYGGRANNFGMGLLLARKLVEAGVTTVEVDLGGWDNHGNIFNTIRTGNGPRVDKGFGNLVKELTERGMWKNTVVLFMSEFGRTPKINQGGGRDHWARAWSVVVGGGAIKGGVAYGANLADSSQKATIGDLFATVYKGLGLDPTTQVRDNLGRPLNIAEGKAIDALV
jgi:hypothetical protein